MWKKKKTKKVETIDSGIKYTGEVIVQKIKRGKIVSEYKNHNAGTHYLFEFLLKCLQGNYSDSLRPYWIATCMETEGEDGTEYNYVSNSIRPLLSSKVSSLSTSNSYIEYKFYLPYRPEYLSKGFNTILLYSSINKPTSLIDGEAIEENYSMIVNFTEEGKPVLIKANEDEDILITWQLNLKN